MKLFQPLFQHGYARVLTETRTHSPLSPGLFSFNSSLPTSGFSGYFDLSVPPSILEFSDSPSKLHFFFSEKNKAKVLFDSLFLSLEPFYPSFLSESISSSEFASWLPRLYYRTGYHQKHQRAGGCTEQSG